MGQFVIRVKGDQRVMRKQPSWGGYVNGDNDESSQRNIEYFACVHRDSRKGTLFYGFTGHDHTHVLIDVRSIKLDA